MFHSLLDFLSRNGDKIGQRTAAKLSEFYTTLKDEEIEETQAYLKTFRLNKCYDQERTRITICLKDVPEVRKALIKAIAELGGDHKAGKAPLGRMERLLQNLLAHASS